MSNFFKRLLDTETSKALLGEDAIKATKKVFMLDSGDWVCAYCDVKNAGDVSVCGSCGANQQDDD